MKRLNQISIFAAAAALSVVTACNANKTSAPVEQPKEMEIPGMTDHEMIDPADALLGPGRDAARLSIDQVSSSFATVLGQPWTVNTTEGYRYPIEYLFGALGQPDYYLRLSEDLDPHLLFAKFLSEGAYAACGDAIEADQSVSRSERHVMRKIDPAETLATSRAAVLENLRDMRLRFHGVRVDPADEASLAPWLQLFTDVSALPDHNAADGWRAVCVAMVTDPEFALN